MRLVARSSEFDATVAAQEAENEQKRADHRQCDLRQSRKNAGGHFDAARGYDALPAQAGVIEHARHPVAVDRVENEHDIEDEQRHVPLARIFQDQERHHAAHDHVGVIPVAGAIGAKRNVLRVHVIGAVSRKDTEEKRDHIIGGRRQRGIEIVRAQRLQRVKNEDDWNQRHREQRRPAYARPVVVEDKQEECDRQGVINAVDNETRPAGRRVGHDHSLISEWRRADAIRRPPATYVAVLDFLTSPRLWCPISDPIGPFP